MKGVLFLVVGIFLMMFFVGGVSAFPCGGEEYNAGYCCSDVWFDQYYQDISGGCPSGNFYYVDQNHLQASDSNPGTEALPWATIGRAAWGSSDRNNPNTNAALQAGDIVIVKDGVYSTTEAVGERYIPIYNSVNSGNPGNYIIFKTENKGGVTLESYTGGEGEPIIGSYQQDYIVWDGFYIDEANVHTKSDTGPVVGWGASYLVFMNLEINGADKSWLDNHNGIRLEYADNVKIYNNKIYEIAGNWGDNEAGIMTYDSHDLIIEHNEIYDSGSGIFIKGMRAPHNTQYNIIVRYNLIYGTNKGLYVYGVHRDYVAYQNIVRDSSGSAVRLTGCGDPCPVNPMFVNNVFDSSTEAGITPILCNIPGAFNGARLWNNIITNSNYVLDSWTGCSVSDFSDESQFDFEHNLYYGNSDFASLAGSSTFSGWQTTTGQDLGPPASLNLNPQYVDEIGDDFRLGVSSPARNAGIDILDLDNDGSTTDAIHMGAYITGDEVIGVIDYTTLSQPECSNSVDDDGDGQTDYPNDAGCTDANDDDESNCGDLVCEGGETCSSCAGDCPTQVGEVCCTSAIYTGDCCTNSDCTSPDNCVSYQCQTSTPCGEADTDSSGDINIGEIINYITRYKNGEVDIGEVIAGITEYRYGC